VRLDESLAAGRLALPWTGRAELRLVEPRDMPPGVAGLLPIDETGACACYERDRRRCAIHRQLGHDDLPGSCQHFPRVCLVDEGRTSITLSHYCPTAARLLFDEAIPLSIVDAPPGFADMALEGLDARGALPPLLRPGMLADRESYRRWERQVVALLGEAGSPEEALARVVDLTEAIRTWAPRDGPLGAALDTAIAAEAGRHPDAHLCRRTRLGAAALVFDRLARLSVPQELKAPAVPPDASLRWDSLVAPAWARFTSPVRRYLAARAFANWCSYQGLGLRTVAASVVTALSVLRVEASRQCAAAGRTLDAALLTDAFRSADLLLVHLASPEDLARRLSEIETASAEEMREAL
jgi:hypothetical protein